MSHKVFAPNEFIKDSLNQLTYEDTVRRQIKTQSVTVGATPTKLPTTPLSDRIFAIIQNVGSVILYIGASDVTTTNGFQLLPFQKLIIGIEDVVDIYGVVSTGTASVIVLEAI